ncbi:MAG TPA: hypothetical protein PLV68_04800 [Ilumatobacteraceae bacterium]|nr:hypothetical protein [Ilumatobacteraceae bacterium]
MSTDDGTRNADSRNNSAASGRSGPSPALIAFAVVAIVSVVLFFRNGDPNTIDFLIFEWRTTVRFSILIAVALGIVLNRLFSIWWRRRRNKRNDR